MKRRLLVGLFVVLAVMTLRPLLYATSVEPTWIPGIYDNGDLDDSLALSSLKALGTEASSTVQRAPALVARLDASAVGEPESPVSGASPSRAPPLL
ncbi:MAG TPA: hypothetical protein VJU81_16800 [Methylomirabilota bacterium]|nr:hypothetical protein [Methylomirabilota bacterium]